MGLREWTEQKLNGNTGNEIVGRSVKSVVEFVYSSIAVSPWAGAIGLVATVSGVSVETLKIPGLPVLKLQGTTTVSIALLVMLIEAYRTYKTQIHCDYP